jgi:hypothetical protein
MSTSTHGLTLHYWRRSSGYLFWGLLGLLCLLAGLFHPIENFSTVFGSGAVIFFLLALFASPNFGDVANACIVVGFGGFLLAMYGIGFAIAALLFGWAVIALIIAVVLYCVGVLGIWAT